MSEYRSSSAGSPTGQPAGPFSNQPVTPSTASFPHQDTKPAGRFFILKNLGLFSLIAFLILCIDLIMVIGIMFFEANNERFDSNASDPAAQHMPHIYDIAPTLIENDDGTWSCNDDAVLEALARYNGWSVLLDPTGNVVWSFNTPSDFPAAFTQNEVALLSHDREYQGYTTFIWTKDAYLVVMGYPGDEYASLGFTMSADAVRRIPLYLLLVFLVGLLLIFLLYIASQHSVIKGTGKLLGALDDIAQGKPTHVDATGALRSVGTTINTVSDTLVHKETARKNWIAGISHDVRTPLAVVMGHAERIENDRTLPEPTRDTAAIISRQGTRIRDLVEDLNIATQLEYDMQPLKHEPLIMAKLVRSVAADYLNQAMLGNATLDVEVAESAARLVLEGDERLLKRALRNAIDNALKHNAADCHIVITLDAMVASESALEHVSGTASGLILRVSDNGRGITPNALATMATMLQHDYLGFSTLIEQTPTRITFSASRSLVIPHDDMPVKLNPEGPAAPLATTTDTYKNLSTPYIKGLHQNVHTAPPKPYFDAKPDVPKPPTTAPISTNPYIPQGYTDCPGNPYAVASTAVATCPSTVGTTPPPHGGSIGQHGLGMPLIARIVLVHGGLFTLESTPGEGFTIIMTFPQARE